MIKSKEESFTWETSSKRHPGLQFLVIDNNELKSFDKKTVFKQLHYLLSAKCLQ